jgi:3-oxoacyl-(acyl-carrier-protein) synthase
MTVPVRRVDDTLLQDPALQPARRAGRMIKMALLAASDCLAGASLSLPDRERLGLVLATGMGRMKPISDSCRDC